MPRPIRSFVLLLLAAAAACAPPRPAATPGPALDPVAGRLPPIPARAGALDIDVVYPNEGQTLGVRDSTFVFGNVGTGEATLTVNGTPVEVAPNGAWLAFLPVPQDGRYRLVATAGGRTDELVREVKLPPAPQPDPVPLPAPDTMRRAGGADVVQQPALPSAPTPALRVAVAASARADGMVVGTAVPGSGTPYHWFFPNTTRLLIDDQRGGQFRVRLTDRLSVWVDSGDVRFLPPGTRPPRGAVGTVAARPATDHVDLRLSTTDRFPFRVDGSERGLKVTVYGAESRTNIMLYGSEDPLLRHLEWEAVADDEYVLHVELGEPLWGFLPFWDEAGNLVVRIRRPPPLNAENPLNGLYIGVDAGHPPGGAIGPTRLTEAQANLAIAQRLVPMLRERGARVLEIRPDTAAVALGARPQIATDSSVHLLVSVHNDALADGVNPFLNSGTHVFYNQPQSQALALAVQRELLEALGLRDLGISRRDLALVRPTWMPSILTESTFMMIPRHEAALRDPAVLERIARAHVQGIESYLRQRALSGLPDRD